MPGTCAPRVPTPWILILGLALLGATPQHAGAPAEDGFEAMMTEANARMHAGMMNARFTGDPDRDFARMMIAHHQGAIDMAVAELRYGKDKRLRRLAQQIVVDQQQEIAAMHLALGDPLPPGSAAPTQIAPHPSEEH